MLHFSIWRCDQKQSLCSKWIVSKLTLPVASLTISRLSFLSSNVLMQILLLVVWYPQLSFTKLHKYKSSLRLERLFCLSVSQCLELIYHRIELHSSSQHWSDIAQKTFIPFEVIKQIPTLNIWDFSLTGRTRVLDILSGAEDQKIPRAWHCSTASPPQAGVVDLETDSMTPTENLSSHLQKPARGHDSQSKIFSRSAKTEPEIFI